MIRPVSALALAVVFALPLAAHADPVMITVPSDAYGFASGQKGLNFGIPSGGSPTIGFSYLLTNRSALELNLGLGATFAGNTDFAFSIEIGYRAYLSRFGDRLYPCDRGALWSGVLPPRALLHLRRDRPRARDRQHRRRRLRHREDRHWHHRAVRQLLFLDDEETSYASQSS
jgi:hypothetical protein